MLDILMSPVGEKALRCVRPGFETASDASLELQSTGTSLCSHQRDQSEFKLTLEFGISAPKELSSFFTFTLMRSFAVPLAICPTLTCRVMTVWLSASLWLT